MMANVRERKVTNEEEKRNYFRFRCKCLYAFNSKNLSSWINVTYVLRQHAKLRLLSDLNEPSLIKMKVFLWTIRDVSFSQICTARKTVRKY